MNTKTVIIVLLWIASLIVVYFLAIATQKPVKKTETVRVQMPPDTITGPMRTQYVTRYQIIADESDQLRLKAMIEQLRRDLADAEHRHAMYEDRYFLFDTVRVVPVYVTQGGHPMDTTHVVEQLSMRISQYPSPWMTMTSSEKEFRINLRKQVDEPKIETGGFWSKFGYGPQLGVGLAAVIERAGENTVVRYRPVPYLGMGVHFSF